MENVVVTIPSADLAAAYTRDFEQLWQKKHVIGTGTFDDEPAPLPHAGAPLHPRPPPPPLRGGPAPGGPPFLAGRGTHARPSRAPPHRTGLAAHPHLLA